MTPGRDALRETLQAIDAKQYQRAGEAALRSVATPLRAAGESLANVLESFAQPEADAAAWRDKVLGSLDAAVPDVLDAVLALYANVLFHRLLHPQETPLFDLDVPSNEDVARAAAAEVDRRGAADATDFHARAATADAAKLVDAIVRVAELWAGCATDAGQLDAFYASAEPTAEQMLSAAKTLRIAAGVFRTV